MANEKTEKAEKVEEPDGRVYAFVGDRRTGKSTLARKLALQECTHGDGEPVEGVLCIYVTPNGDVSDPWPGPTLTGEQIEKLLAEDDPTLPPIVAFRGGPPVYDAAASLALDVCERWRVVLIIDEAHRVWREGFGDGTPMAQIFHEGRHRGIDLYIITQWPARADKRIFRAADSMCWFRLHSPEDLNWICGRYSIEAADEVASLGNYCFVEIVGDEPPEHWKWRANRRKPAETKG